MELPTSLKSLFPKAITLVDALNSTIASNRLSEMDMLLSNYQFDVNQKGEYLLTLPIHNAIGAHNPEAIKMLKKVRGFNINQTSHIESSSPAIAAAIRQNSDVIKEVCFDPKADLTIRNKFGNNVLAALIAKGYTKEYFQIMNICPDEVFLQEGLCKMTLIDKIYKYNQLQLLQKTVKRINQAQNNLGIKNPLVKNFIKLHPDIGNQLIAA
tara:strand:+ start:2215 stop:2847 length:633 start_codon:yes stop_codon:yes gene_type:complete